MDKLFYTNEALTEKSAVPLGSDLPAIYFELLEYDLSSLPKGLTIYDIEWTSEGGVILPDAEQQEGIKRAKLKPIIEGAAFAQQNKIIDQNMAEFLWDMFKNFDLSVCPIASNYKDFMNALWLQYHTDKASLNESFDYSTIVPADDYSYQEIEAEYIENRS